MNTVRPIAARSIKATQWLCVVLTALFLLFPLANDLFEIVPEPVPAGLQGAPAALQYSRAALEKRVWQRRLETRAKKESGLWLFLLKAGNEIYRLLFGQISSFNDGSILLGNEEHLLQTAHLAAFNHRRASPVKKMRARLLVFKKLQDEMKARGKALIMLISPNAMELYPELLPEDFRDPGRETRQSDYDRARQLLDELGIIYVDAFELLNSQKGRYPFRFIARSGSHWNDVASCLSLKAIDEKLRSVGLPHFREFSCERWHMEDLPKGKDRDLLKIANLLLPDRLLDPTPYVDIEYKEPEQTNPPRVLLVGTSYLFALTDHLHYWGLTKDLLLYFYYRQWRPGARRNFNLIRKDLLDWNDLLSRDIIIVNAGMASPLSLGYGFVDDTVKKWEKLYPVTATPAPAQHRKQ